MGPFNPNRSQRMSMMGATGQQVMNSGLSSPNVNSIGKNGVNF